MMNQPETDKTFLRKPLQERSRRTLQKILSAGLHLLEEEGSEALTVSAITRRARISVGSFYARFDGKDDLLRFMGEEALEDALLQWQEGKKEKDRSIGEEGSSTFDATIAFDLLLSLYLEGPGRSLALLEGIQDPVPSRRRRLEEAVAREVTQGFDLDPQRTGIRVRALVGLLQDIARQSALGDKAEVEYGFLADIEILREEGVTLLRGVSAKENFGGGDRAKAEEGPSAEASEAHSEAPEVSEVSAASSTLETSDEPDTLKDSDGSESLESLERVDTPEAPEDPEISEAPDEPDTPQETDAPPEPDPFDVWG